MKIIRTPEGKLRTVGGLAPGSVFEYFHQVYLRTSRFGHNPPIGVDLSNGTLLFLSDCTEVRELEAHVEVEK